MIPSLKEKTLPQTAAFSLEDLPPEIIKQILFYLDMMDINRFLKVMQKLIQKELFWEVLIEKLKKLDPTLPQFKLKNYQSLERSCRYIAQQQMQEIALCRQKNPSAAKYLKDLNQPAATLTDLMEREENLNSLNSERILGRIEAGNNLRKNNPILHLSGADLTRLPGKLMTDPEHKAYWQSVTVLYCDSNHLRFLPAEIQYCTALEAINCSRNQLQLLPAELGNCPALEGLDVSHNYLSSLPPTLLPKFENAWKKASTTNNPQPKHSKPAQDTIGDPDLFSNVTLLFNAAELLANPENTPTPQPPKKKLSCCSIS